MKKQILIALLSIFVLACASTKTNSAISNLSPETIQKNMVEASELKPEHKLLSKMAGEWKVNAKFWMDPTAEPEISSGVASSKLIYGGRYLDQKYKGKFMGKPFEGQGTMGYDNLGKKYFSTWIDSMSTMMMKSEGKTVNDNSLTLESSMVCPMTREEMQSQEVITFLDKNTYRFETFQNSTDQKIKMMELTYSRIH